MIPYTPSNIDTGYYVGIVSAYDTTTREIAVYLPKLMPNITEGTTSFTTLTNMGSLQLPVSVIGNMIKEESFIWVKAEDIEEPMPVEGSRVIVYFIDGNPNSGYWRKFNLYGVDYNTDAEDKFEKDYLFTANFIYVDKNGASQTKSIDIHKDDIVDVVLPDSMKINIMRDVEKMNNVKISIEKE